MELAVKNMVCARCIKVVKDILAQLHIDYTSVELGKIYLPGTLAGRGLQQLQNALEKEGFEIISDEKAVIIEQIKKQIIHLVYNTDLEVWNENLSVYLSKALHKDYSALSHLFSSAENITIEQYFIFQKLERVKEMLVYDKLSLNEIAFKMGYSSVAHLSAQFKKITGFTPSAFRILKEHHKTAIDKIA